MFLQRNGTYFLNKPRIKRLKRILFHGDRQNTNVAKTIPGLKQTRISRKNLTRLLPFELVQNHRDKIHIGPNTL